MELPLDSEKIRELIPHRYPILLVDKVLEFHQGEKIIGQKNVSSNEPFFQGHFPERPIMPGVLILEALAQLGVLYAKIANGSTANEGLSVFAGVDKVKFRRPVVPGDILMLEMLESRRKKRIWVMEGKATVNGEVAASGILTAAEIS